MEATFRQCSDWILRHSKICYVWWRLTSKKMTVIDDHMWQPANDRTSLWDILLRPVLYGVKTRTRMLPILQLYWRKSITCQAFTRILGKKSSQTRFPVHTAVRPRKTPHPGRITRSYKSPILHQSYTAVQHGACYTAVYQPYVRMSSWTSYHKSEDKLLVPDALSMMDLEQQFSVLWWYILVGHSSPSHWTIFLRVPNEYLWHMVSPKNPTCRRFDTIPACDRRTDGRTELP